MVPEKVIESLLFSVLGCSDPLFSTVRSLLPASSSSATDLRCAAWISLPCNSRLQFRATHSTEELPVTLQESCLQRTANPQILRILCILRICSWYLLSILLYSCLFYNVNIVSLCVRNSLGSMAEVLRSVTLCNT